MAYAQIDVAALRHPKVLALSDAAFRLWVAGLAYCQEHLTDGSIPAVALVVLGVKVSPKSCEELITQRLWEREPEGFHVHDYLRWNESREQVEKRREEARTRAKRARERAEARADAQHAHGPYSVSTATAYAQRSDLPSGRGAGEGTPVVPIVRRRDLSSPFDWLIPVPAKLHTEIVGREAMRFNGDTAAAETAVLDWYASVAEDWNDRGPLPGDDGFEFWRKRYKEWRGVTAADVKGARRKAADAELDAWARS